MLDLRDIVEGITLTILLPALFIVAHLAAIPY